jgi:hypothetical protein
MDRFVAEFGKPIKQEMSLARFVQRDVDMFKEAQETKPVIKQEKNDWKSIFSGAYASNKRRKLAEDATPQQLPPAASEALPEVKTESNESTAPQIVPVEVPNTPSIATAKPTVVAGFNSRLSTPTIAQPPGFELIPLDSLSSFQAWSQEVLKCSKVICAAVNRSQMTSFRRAFKPAPVGKVKFEDDFISMKDSLVALAIMTDQSNSKPWWLPIHPPPTSVGLNSTQSDAVDSAAVLDFVVQLLESTSVEKIIFNVQKLLFEIIRLKGEDCTFPREMSSIRISASMLFCAPAF